MASKPRYASLHTTLSSKEASRLLVADVQDVEYEICYFEISCLGSTPRYLLSYAGANWKNKYPNAQKMADPESTERHQHPFGVVPTLKVKAADGEGEILLAEAFNIDLFLAKKFGLLGENEFEELTIRAFYSQIHFLRERSLMRTTWTFPDKRQMAWEEFINTTLPGFIEQHEQHLEHNESNGHYFGKKLTLADIHLVSAIDHFAELPRANDILDLFKASPLLWKVVETAREHPQIASWRDSDEFRNLVKGGKVVYSRTAFTDKQEE
ncbi:Glutathione S-transferase S1 [Mortierella sp. GBA30]|nr:Glutathione S-transferase S1 [Mortierella sp. GBA30]